jgi:hypothetical protein
MSSISSYLQNSPPVDFHRKKLLLNEEFHKKAKIKGLVSYIYYPSQREFPLLGHAELEVEGRSWTLMYGGPPKERCLSNMIRSSQTGHGFPFFRFNISVTPSQLQALREKSMQTRGLTCSMGVLKALSSYGKYSVPFPVTISPLAAATYLYIAKKLGSRHINQIEIYRGPDRMRNVAKSVTGVFVESIGISSYCYLLYLMGRKVSF